MMKTRRWPNADSRRVEEATTAQLIVNGVLITTVLPCVASVPVRTYSMYIDT